jgi:hypothetical protein
MEHKARAAPGATGGQEDEAGLTPAEQTSKVGDLGRGSHEETQPVSGEPKDLPGTEPPPKGRP